MEEINEEMKAEEPKTNGAATFSEEEKLAIGVELPTRLSQEHFDLFKPALNEMLIANQKAQEAQQLFAQAQRIQTQTQGALQYIVRHLQPKYGMKDGDDLDQDGVIIRK